MTKSCAICQVEFEPNRSAAKYCSGTCRKRAHRLPDGQAWTPDNARRHGRPRATPLVPHRCRWCASPGVDGKRAFCSRKCAVLSRAAEMPRRPGMTCASCARPMHVSRGSLAQGEATCRPCRSAAQPECRRCAWCADRGIFKGRFCSRICANQAHGRERAPEGRRVKGSTTDRGYGSAHAAMRVLALASFRDGDPCSRCERPMRAGEALDLDHDDDRRGYLGLAHRSCNRRAGGQKGNGARWGVETFTGSCVRCGAETYRKYCSNACKCAVRRRLRAQRAAA